MSEDQSETRGWLKSGSWKEYVLGLALGPVSALYGCVALLMDRTFLPGHKTQGHLVGGLSGRALAGAYLMGGIYLVLRFVLAPRVESPRARSGLYFLQNLLLVGFIGSLLYVLVHVGEVQ